MDPVHMVRRVVGWNTEEHVTAGIELPLRSIRRVLLGVIVALVPVNLLIGYLKWLDYEDTEQPLSFLRYFDLGEEQAFPAWVATMLLASAALCAVAAAQHSDHDKVIGRGFRITAAALAYVSLDEATYLHERASEPLRDGLGLSGPFYWAWVLPAVIAVAILTKLLWPFIMRIPAEVRHDLLLSAAVYVGCSVGLEMLDGIAYAANDEEASVVTEVLTIVEESGELLAAMLFVDAALQYIAGRTAARSAPT